jgi:hypothetical protein
LVLQRCETIGGDHGRMETRRYTICHTIDWPFSDRRYPGECRVPGVAAMGMIESETERGSVIEKERRYSLISAKLNPETFARAMRGHWGSGTICIWCWGLCSTMILRACAPVIDRQIWRSSSISR